MTYCKDYFDGLLHLLRNKPQIRALSVRQPWAHHILFDGKDIENRTWRTDWRGWVLLHAGIRPDGGGMRERRKLEAEGMQFGGIIGAMMITDCVQASTSPWFQGPYGMVIGQARPLQFLACRGELSFFRPDIDRTKLQWAEV